MIDISPEIAEKIQLRVRYELPPNFSVIIDGEEVSKLDWCIKWMGIGGVKHEVEYKTRLI